MSSLCQTYKNGIEPHGKHNTRELRSSRDMAFKQMGYILKNAPEIKLVYLIKIAASKCTYLEKFLSYLHSEIPLP